jgi:serine/threonine protein kinase
MAWLKNLLGTQADPHEERLREARKAEDAGDWVRAGFCYEQVGDLQNALRAYEKARDYTLCAELALRMDRTDLAAKFFLLAGDKRQAAQLLEQLGEHERAVELFVETGSFAEAGVRFVAMGEYLRAGEVYLQGGLHEEAGDAFEKAGEDLQAAESYLAGHHFSKAAAAFERAKEYARAGKVYENSGRPIQAGAAFEKAGEFLLAALAYRSLITESGVESRYLVGEEQEKRGKLARLTARCFEKAGKIEEAGKVLEEAGEYELAAEIAKKLGEHRRAAELFSQAGQTDRAVEMYRLAGDERTASALSGEHELSLGNQEAAAESFVRSGDFVRAAEIFFTIEQFGRAADCYEKVEAYAEAADSAFRAGDRRRSATFFEKANDLERAAKLYAETGDPNRAMNLYAEAGRFFQAAEVARDHSEEKMMEYLQRVPPGDEHYRKAVEVLAFGFIEKGWGSLAVDKLSSLLSGDSVRLEDLDLWNLLSRAYQSQGNLKMAADLLHKMLEVQHNFKDIAPRHRKLLEQVEEQESRERLLRNAADSKAEARYAVQDLLGQGGMGSVYRAYDKLLKRPVAYKVLSDALANEPKARAQLIEEARAAAALNHPNIITVHDIGLAKGKTFICMELIEGESYASLLKKKKRLAVPEAMHLLVSVCQGLDHAHHRKIVHRDLKPSNLLLTTDDRVKIVDFGLSMPIHRGEGSGGGAILVGGTPKYIPPEQARGEPCDPRSDIYSLGASVYELLLGEAPFVGENLIQQHLHARAPSLRSRGLDVPAALDELVLLAMAKDPSERFQSAGEMISFASAARLL